MKKIITVLLVAILCLGAVFALTACNNDGDLQFDERYIRHNEYEYSGYVTKTTESYTFNKNGTGVFECVEVSKNKTINIGNISQYFEEYKYGYKIYFKYVYLDNDKSTVVLFYDGVSYNNGNTLDKSVYIENVDYSDWDKVLIVSKNVCLSQSGGNRYLRESFWDDVPNYDMK